MVAAEILLGLEESLTPWAEARWEIETPDEAEKDSVVGASFQRAAAGPPGRPSGIPAEPRPGEPPKGPVLARS